MDSTNRVYNVKDMSGDEFITHVTNAMSKTMDGTKFKFVEGNMTVRTFRSRVKTMLWNPIVSLAGLVSTKCGDEKCAVNVEYTSRTNAWFWFTFLIGCFFWPLWILMIWMWVSQKKKTVIALNNALDSLEYEFAEL